MSKNSAKEFLAASSSDARLLELVLSPSSDRRASLREAGFDFEPEELAFIVSELSRLGSHGQRDGPSEDGGSSGAP